MGALLNDPSAVNNQDLAGIPDCCKTVGDHDPGFPLGQLLDGQLDIPLILRVNAGCGFIQYNYRCIF